MSGAHVALHHPLIYALALVFKQCTTCRAARVLRFNLLWSQDERVTLARVTDELGRLVRGRDPHIKG